MDYTNADLEMLANEINAVAAFWNEPMSERRAELYLKVLLEQTRMSAKQVLRSMAMSYEQDTHFPMPVDLLTRTVHP